MFSFPHYDQEAASLPETPTDVSPVSCVTGNERRPGETATRPETDPMKRGNDVPTLLEYCSDRDIDIDDPRALIEVGDEEEDGAEIRLHTYDHYDPNSNLCGRS